MSANQMTKAEHDAAYQRAYHQFHTLGWKVTRIAEEMGVHAATIRRWLSNTKLQSKYMPPPKTTNVVDMMEKIKVVTNPEMDDLMELLKRIPTLFLDNKSSHEYFNGKLPQLCIHINDLMLDQTTGPEGTEDVLRRLARHVETSLHCVRSVGDFAEVNIWVTGRLTSASKKGNDSNLRTAEAICVLSQVIKDVAEQGYNVNVIMTPSWVPRGRVDISSKVFDLLRYKVQGSQVSYHYELEEEEWVHNINDSHFMLFNQTGKIGKVGHQETSGIERLNWLNSQSIEVDYLVLGSGSSPTLPLISSNVLASGGFQWQNKGGVFHIPTQNSYIVHSDGSLTTIKNDLKDANGWVPYMSFSEYGKRSV